MIVNYDEEYRKALESMKDAPYDYFESGCSFCGDAVEWALKTIDSQRTEIERLQPKKGHWQMKPDPFGLFDGIPVCSECGCTNAMRRKTAYCEHCGADMREGAGDA